MAIALAFPAIGGVLVFGDRVAGTACCPAEALP